MTASAFRVTQFTILSLAACVLELGYSYRTVKNQKRALKLVYIYIVNIGELYTATNSCGITRFPCDSTAFLFYM